jgi:uncharacterized protein
MNSPASSFPAERKVRRWYHEPWPWLLISGPFVAVVASLASAWMAITSDDGVVAQDYYKQGITINQRLARMAPDAIPLGARITIGERGEMRAHIEGLVEPPKNVRLTLAHPATVGRAEVVILESVAGGDYVGALAKQTPGRWIVTLESDSWRLPTTTVAGPLSEIRLGSAERY